jgi:DNA-binding LytR/AlgR family response regulator
LKGFDLNVTDYLLKPYTFERFYQAIEKAQTNLVKKQAYNSQEIYFCKNRASPGESFFEGNTLHRGMRDYRRIHTINKRIMTLQTFKDFELEIPPGIICRVHKSFMVSIDKIDSIEKDQIKIKDKIIPIFRNV